MPLHIPTLTIVAGLTLLVTALGMLLVPRVSSGRAPFRWWAAGCAAGGLGWSLVTLRPPHDPLASMLVVGEALCFYLALRCHEEAPPSRRELAVWALGVLGYGLVLRLSTEQAGTLQSLPLVSSLSAAANGAAFIVVAWLLLHNRGGLPIRLARAVGVMFGIAGVLSAVSFVRMLGRDFPVQPPAADPVFFVMLLLVFTSAQCGALLLALEAYVAQNESLARSEGTLRSLLDALKEGAFLMEPQGTVLAANATLAERLGTTVEEILGRSIYDVLPPEVVEGRKARMAELLATRKAVRFSDVRGQRTIEHTVYPVFNAEGGVARAVVISFDVTDRLKAEREVRESEERFRSLIEQSPLCITLARHGRVLYANPAFARQYGYDDPDAVVGHAVEDFVAPEERPAVAARTAQREQGGRVEPSHEALALRKDGSTFYVRAAVASVDLADGPAVLGFFQDVSESRQAEQALREAKVAAEAATRVRSEFVTNMSHEIRTPMNVITGLAWLALQGDLAPRQQDYVGKILRASEGLLHILDDALDSSKIEAGRMTLEVAPFRLAEVFDGLRDSLASLAEEKHLLLVFSCDPRVPATLEGDPLRLRQVLENLASNAVKFTERGHVLVSVEMEGEPEGGRVALRFSVVDTGIGLDPSDWERLCEPFTQGDSSFTRRYGGNGLGLYIATRLLALMGSRLEAKSRPGEGTRLSFTLSLAAPDLVPEIPPVPAEMVGQRVLLAHSHPVARHAAERMLGGLGLRVTAVESPAAAVAEVERAAARADEGAYRLVVTEGQASNGDAAGLLRHLRRLACVPCPPRVILLAGEGSAGIRQQAEELGVRAFVSPPLLPTVLVEAMETALARKETAARDDAEPVSPDVMESLQGARVLLVEDNPIHQQVGRELLTRCGVRVEVVEDGQAAVERLARRPSVDVILMDLEMPRLDGYEAACAIRREHAIDTLPIVALTAYVQSEERERAFAAGMNDHLAKPITQSALCECLSRWVKRPTTPRGGAPDDLSFLSPGINVAEALWRLGDNRELFRAVVLEFHRRNQDVVAQIRGHLEGGALKAACALAHALKGAAGSVGAEGVLEVVRRLEEQLRAQRTEGLEPLLEALDQRLRELFSSIARLESETARSAEGGRPASVASDEVVRQVEELRGLLQVNRLEALEVYERLRRTLPPSPEFDLLTLHMRKLDFKKALAQLDQVAQVLGIT